MKKEKCMQEPGMKTTLNGTPSRTKKKWSGLVANTCKNSVFFRSSGQKYQKCEKLGINCHILILYFSKTNILNNGYSFHFQPIDFLAPAQIDLINLYEKYLTLIHRRFKWKLRPLSPVLTEDANISNETMDGKRRRKRKCSSQDHGKDSPSNKKSNQLSERSGN